MPTELIDAVAISIRRLRMKAGLSQEVLGSIAGLDRTYISGIERGQRNISLASLERLVTALGVELSTFLNDLAEIVTRKDND